MIVTTVLAITTLAALVNGGAIAFFDTNPSIKYESPSAAGTYSAWELCPYDVYSNKFSYWFSANNGATGVRLNCGTHAIKITSNAIKGALTQESADCAGGFDGFQVKYTSTNGITQLSMQCSSDSMLKTVPPPAGIAVTGEMDSSTMACSSGYKICGVRTMIESVGLTGVEFLCCEGTSDTTNDISDTCDFEADMCGWDNSTTFITRLPDFNYVSAPTNIFNRATLVPQRSRSRTGPADNTGAASTTHFIYYESAVDDFGSDWLNNATLKRRFDSPTYSAAIWRDTRFKFYFHAYGDSLGELYFQVRDLSDNIVQEQPLFNPFRIDGETYGTSQDAWRGEEEFLLYVNGTDFKISFEVKNGRQRQSGDFGLDQFTIVHKDAGTCANPGCHHNATCVDNPALLTGFTCTCPEGFNGTGYNTTSGCIEINQCQDIPDLCKTNNTMNQCNQLAPGNYTCQCDDTGYEANANSTDCMNINECATTDICGVNATCTDLIGNFTCACDAGFTNNNQSTNIGTPLYNLTCDANGGWTEWAAPGGLYPCSVSCGGGTYNATRNCTNPSPVGVGADCVGIASNMTECNTDQCPLACPVWKNCSACANFTDFKENGPLNMTLTYFSGLSANDLTFAMTKLSQWNQTVVEEICVTAYCNVATLNASITSITADTNSVNDLTTAVTSAKLEMRDILDCNADTDSGHNEWLWEIFDKLCEYEAFLPHIYEDLKIKSDMLVAERDRCMGRTTMRSLLELMYRKW